MNLSPLNNCTHAKTTSPLYPLPTWKRACIVFMMIGTMMVFVSTWWILSWTGLVINLIATIPLLAISKSSLTVEAATKYFILQSIAATTIMMSLFLHPMLPSPIVMMLMLGGFTMKLGAAPFHFWVPQIFDSLPWLPLFLVSTWQKLAPLGLLMSTSDFLIQSPVTSIALLSMAIGSFGAWTTSSLKKLLAYSSINQTGWMLMLTQMSLQMTGIYFLIYTIQMAAFIYLANSMWSKPISPKPTSYSHPSKSALFLALLFLSMGGLPPLVGFITKLMVMSMITQELTSYITLSIIILTSLIMTTVYLSLMMNSIPPGFTPSNTPTMNNLAILIPTLIIPLLIMSSLILLFF